ncbi:aspartate aminotransferase family protein [Phenylobacterium sp.]|jgi:acetylornithine/N-succinyldiaminopimelate aminotransferase|uniref:aspartate aminotransferase family protein n=1 Tax=Phenylobacterium sp. TaxID=1871053 RepID=UPI002E317080|nr:aspartate aminotransferase family protein [Phenylobacterium sp.]HEX3365168.1 aspartate aminotransferase family protein [Phenylobacterium sp.]
MGVYSRTPLAFERGEGARLYTTDGDAYLDCMAGIAVNALGHANPILVAALKAQAEKLWHTSNIFTIPNQEKLAKALTDASFADEVFFTNSGTEAIECAIKTARKYHWAMGAPERIDIIGFDGSFHGRTLAAVNASGNASYLEGFGPPMPGFVHLPFGDMDALCAAVGPTTAAIILEPVQGEGGARSWPEADLTAIRKLCDETGTLLIYDEIQCGLGRTGKLFAYEWAADAAPDIMAIAKALGGGFPVGACLATAEAGRGMTVGSHGSTYGGNPLAMAVGEASVAELVKPELMAHVRELVGYFKQQLGGLTERYPDVVEEIRGKGLLIGLKLHTPNREFMQHAREQHLLIAGGGDNCVRLLPPLNLTLAEASEAIGKLEGACEAARAKVQSQARAPAA